LRDDDTHGVAATKDSGIMNAEVHFLAFAWSVSVMLLLTLDVTSEMAGISPGIKIKSTFNRNEYKS
jgi:hypothetical protein